MLSYGGTTSTSLCQCGVILVCSKQLPFPVYLTALSATKLIIGANFALPAAGLCICIHLERVASVRLAQNTVSDKRRRQLFEAGMCIGLPIVFMALRKFQLSFPYFLG